MLALIGLRAGFQKRNPEDIQYPRVRAVAVLTLMLRDFLAVPLTHRPDPAPGPAFAPLSSGNAAPVQFSGIGQTHDLLDLWHRLFPFIPDAAGGPRCDAEDVPIIFPLSRHVSPPAPARSEVPGTDAVRRPEELGPPRALHRSHNVGPRPRGLAMRVSIPMPSRTRIPCGFPGCAGTERIRCQESGTRSSHGRQ